MAVRFYWTLVLIAGDSEHSDTAAVDEAQFMVERDAWMAGGCRGNNLDHRRSSPIFVVGENDRMKEIVFIERIAAALSGLVRGQQWPAGEARVRGGRASVDQCS
jgi:hypothetical protein